LKRFSEFFESDVIILHLEEALRKTEAPEIDVQRIAMLLEEIRNDLEMGIS
jgi:hypothetical protein